MNNTAQSLLLQMAQILPNFIKQLKLCAMKNYVKTMNCSTKDGYKTGRKTIYSFDNALKGLGVVNKWDIDLAVKK